MKKLLYACMVMGVLALRTSVACAEPMTIEQAYATVAHPYLIFNPHLTTAPQDESRYLIQLFHLIDLSVKERVETLTWIQSHGARGDDTDAYGRLLAQFRALTPPAKLASVHQLTLSAIQEQRAVLNEWRAHPEQVSMNHPLVHSSSQKLHQAYNAVVSLYHAENRQNQAAFYNYFCCLDFL